MKLPHLTPVWRLLCPSGAVLTVGLALAVLAASLICSQAQAQSVNGASAISVTLTERVQELITAGTDTLRRRQSSAANDDLPGPPATPGRKTELIASSRIAPPQQVHARYTAQQSEIIDHQHHLIWSRCSVGQQWRAALGCVGKVRQYTFDRAQHLANEVWRLPTRTELATLIDHTQARRAVIDSIAFPDMDPDRLYYWTSTEENGSFAWALLFTEGGVPGILYRNHRFALRLVRSSE